MKHQRPTVLRLGCGSVTSGNVSSRKHETPCVCTHYSIFCFGALASKCLQISLRINVGDQAIVRSTTICLQHSPDVTRQNGKRYSAEMDQMCPPQANHEIRYQVLTRNWLDVVQKGRRCQGMLSR